MVKASLSKDEVRLHLVSMLHLDHLGGSKQWYETLERVGICLNGLKVHRYK